MIKKHIASLLIGIIGITATLTGCSSIKTSSLMPEKIVAKAMESNNKIGSYYGEGKIIISENNKIIESSTIKDYSYVSGEKVKKRFEINENGKITISTNDGQKTIIYMKNENKALVSKELSNAKVSIQSPKEQFMTMLQNIKKTHEISNAGEEDINGIKTYHLKATPKQKNNIIGEANLWVDKENYFVIKQVINNANTKTEFEYTKVNFSPKLDNDLFTQNLPSGVKIENVDENKENKKDITFKDASKYIGKPILCVDKSLGYNMKSMKLYMYNSKIAEDEIIQEYEKNNKSVFSVNLRKEQKIDAADKTLDEKDITVRGKKGTSMEDGIRIICWNENGASYTFMINDPKMSIAQAKNIIEKMDFAK